MVIITYNDIRDILKMNIDFVFDEKKAREYKCLDILNELAEKWISEGLEVANTFLALRQAYDVGYAARRAEEREKEGT